MCASLGKYKNHLIILGVACSIGACITLLAVMVGIYKYGFIYGYDHRSFVLLEIAFIGLMLFPIMFLGFDTISRIKPEIRGWK